MASHIIILYLPNKPQNEADCPSGGTNFVICGGSDGRSARGTYNGRWMLCVDLTKHRLSRYNYSCVTLLLALLGTWHRNWRNAINSLINNDVGLCDQRHQLWSMA